MGYMDLPGLGGLRRRQPGFPNGGWKNGSLATDFSEKRGISAPAVAPLFRSFFRT
jgi:hypothetical protein